MTYTAKDFAGEIRERFPEQSPVQSDDTNPGAVLIDSSIGRELTNVETWLFNNSDHRFISRATGVYLDRYGAWFGLPRPAGLSDSDYRKHLISFRGASITISGMKTAISTILDIDREDINITNTYPDYVTVGSVVTANYVTGTPGKFSGYYNALVRTLTIQIPTGSDPDSLLDDLVENMIIPNITYNIEEV